MNKLMSNFTLLMVLLATSFFSHSMSDKLMEIEDYNKELKAAIRLYKENNYDKALPQLELFAKRGDKMSQYIVGTMYLNGQGTPQDLAKSYAWLTVANEQKSKAWLLPLKMLEEKLPADYLKTLNVEGEKYVTLYGAKSQRLKCKNERELGSKQPIHRCKKIEVKNGHYFVDEHQTYNAMID
ncbi:hypothetical protein SAMN05216262_109112 [Colwellia chukchiensis]|uniref:Sel1 repeat-containing protein n=1 Tax=Colwellia chukchiensis TaxID=641665 RepID=A0A1H7PGB9_9GAMM|nr:sel1 repeat family protein [Colwellia chukchiensis]SEL34821.1 hypothetical protein SAMN05216262_109112 [Colwellia chukchiensis]